MKAEGPNVPEKQLYEAAIVRKKSELFYDALSRNDGKGIIQLLDGQHPEIKRILFTEEEEKSLRSIAFKLDNLESREVEKLAAKSISDTEFVNRLFDGQGGLEILNDLVSKSFDDAGNLNSTGQAVKESLVLRTLDRAVVKSGNKQTIDSQKLTEAIDEIMNTDAGKLFNDEELKVLRGYSEISRRINEAANADVGVSLAVQQQMGAALNQVQDFAVAGFSLGKFISGPIAGIIKRKAMAKMFFSPEFQSQFLPVEKRVKPIEHFGAYLSLVDNAIDEVADMYDTFNIQQQIGGYATLEDISESEEEDRGGNLVETLSRKGEVSRGPASSLIGIDKPIDYKTPEEISLEEQIRNAPEDRKARESQQEQEEGSLPAVRDDFDDFEVNGHRIIKVD